jgi:hypothetical protein
MSLAAGSFSQLVTNTGVNTVTQVPQESVRFTRSNTLKLIATGCFLSLTIALLAISEAPARGYELSIYSSTPLIVWVLLALSLVGGIGLVVYHIFVRENSTHWLLIGFIIIALSNLIIIYLAVLRGYVLFSAGDTFGHVTAVMEIISAGHIEYAGSLAQFYPMTYTLAVSIVELAGLTPLAVVIYLPGIFSIVFVSLIYLLAKAVCSKREFVLLATASSIPLFFSYYHVALYPEFCAVAFLPLIFYLYLKSTTVPETQFKALFIISLFYFTFLYPPLMLAFIVVMIALEAVKMLRSRSLARVAIMPILIATVAFFAWVMSTVAYAVNVLRLKDFLESGEPTAAKAQIVAQTTGKLSGLNLLDYIVKLYGVNLAYFAICVVAGVLILKRLRTKKLDNLLLVLVFLVTAFLFGFFLFDVLNTETFGRFLHLNYAIVAAPLLVGFVLFKLFQRSSTPKTMSLIALFLVASSIGSVVSVYPSPITLEASWQTTYADVAATHWFLEGRDQGFVIQGLGYNPGIIGFVSETYPDLRTLENFNLKVISNPLGGGIPDHFGYSQNASLPSPSLSATLGRPSQTYVLMTDRFKTALTSNILMTEGVNEPASFRTGFTNNDVTRLNGDATVNKVYTNGGFDMYIVNAHNPG